jgi:hypothetical protein
MLRWSSGAHHAKGDREPHQPQHHRAKVEDDRDHPADLAGLRVPAAGRVHDTGIHFAQVIAGHRPGDDAQDPADAPDGRG